MTKKSLFTKPPTTPKEQITLLQKRGMVVDDEAVACCYLQHINYYRLGAYWLPFEKNSVTHDFQPRTNFTTVLSLYNFDRALRLLVLEALERIEISIRTQWTSHMAHNHGSHAHSQKNLAVNFKRYEQNLENIKKDVDRADEIFIRHSREKYAESLPAIWKVSEVISFGVLSKLYSNLKPMPTRRGIAETYLLDDKLLSSWLHHLTYIRNLCAHHSRLWNREFTNIPMRPKNKPQILASEFIRDSRKLYNTLVILLYCMDIIDPKHKWRLQLKILLNQDLPLSAMDFPSNWQARNIWQNKE
jgi:abortive infection bacteriophage resistance protein